MLEYHDALKREANGDAVVAMMDESYIHQRHHAEYSFVPTTNSKRRKLDNSMTRASRDGLRGCFAHAITKYGSMVRAARGARALAFSRVRPRSLRRRVGG